MKRTVFPTRRRSAAALRFISTCDFLIGCTLGALVAVLAASYFVMQVLA